MTALCNLVKQALEKYDEQITEVWAVPPFASEDLTYEFDHLKSAYAKLIEQILLQRNGALVVELAEAEAVAKEVMLTEPGARVRRQLPFYLLGKYRHRGQGPKRRLAIELRLVHGRDQLQAIAKSDLTPEDVPRFLRHSTAEVLRKSGGAAQPLSDPETEARQLADRAKTFWKTGQWTEALSLIEASLLLKPDQSDLHTDAVHVLTHLVQLPREGVAWDQNVQSAAHRFQYFRRGLEHLEALTAKGTPLLNPNEPWSNIKHSFLFSSCFLIVGQNVPEEVKAARAELLTFRRETLLGWRHLEVRAVLSSNDPEVWRRANNAAIYDLGAAGEGLSARAVRSGLASHHRPERPPACEGEGAYAGGARLHDRSVPLA